MILVYQMLHGLLNVDTSFFTIYASTRSHNFTLFKESFTDFARANLFSNRVTNDWNSLPDYIINADSLTTYENLKHGQS